MTLPINFPSLPLYPAWHKWTSCWKSRLPTFKTCFVSGLSQIEFDRGSSKLTASGLLVPSKYLGTASIIPFHSKSAWVSTFPEKFLRGEPDVQGVETCKRTQFPKSRCSSMKRFTCKVTPFISISLVTPQYRNWEVSQAFWIIEPALQHSSTTASFLLSGDMERVNKSFKGASITTNPSVARCRRKSLLGRHLVKRSATFSKPGLCLIFTLPASNWPRIQSKWISTRRLFFGKSKAWINWSALELSDSSMISTRTSKRNAFLGHHRQVYSSALLAWQTQGLLLACKWSNKSFAKHKADTAPQPRWKTKPDGEQMGRQNWDGRQIGPETSQLDRRQAQRGGHSIPAKVKDKARWEQNGDTKLGDKARWETNWETQ